MNEGVYLIDKETGWTSFDVVAWFKSRLQTSDDRLQKKKKIPKSEVRRLRAKVGHAGTLDPFATGLLIILVGKEFTKRQDEFKKLDKEYEATLKLGFSSSTGDTEGVISKDTRHKKQGTNKFKIPNSKAVQDTLKKFIGEIDQTPPAYSAIKIDGERAYKKARRGEEFEISRRKVTIYELDLIEYKYPLVKFRVKCSSGTYIRTLGIDIAEKLGTKGYLTELRRTKIGEYDVKDAKKISELSV